MCQCESFNFFCFSVNKSLDSQEVTIHTKGINMSAINTNPTTIIFDTNTILEPIHIWIGERHYIIEDETMMKYLLSEIYNKGYLYLESLDTIPLRRIK